MPPVPPDETYKIGDIVQLKSGGPKMTVDTIPKLPTHNHYGCTWFAGAKKEQSSFHVDVIETAVTGKAKTSGS